MAELVYLANGRCDLKAHCGVKNFKRIELFKYKKQVFKIFVDKNDSIYDILRSEVTEWKISGNKKIPSEITEERDLYFFNKIKGNPYKIGINKIKDTIDYADF